MKPWHKALVFGVTKTYFRSVKFYGEYNIPTGEPVLFAALHKNGAVDGWVYLSVLPPSEVLISAQLTRNPLLKLFFSGIEVLREKDGADRQTNIKALNTCVNVLERGNNLLVFPEGTSTLGCKHLEFQKGAALIIKKYFKNTQQPLCIVPLAVFYDDPASLGGKVEVVAGPAIRPQSDDTEEIHAQLSAALEGVGVDSANEDTFAAIKRFAVCASLDGRAAYAQAAKFAQNNPTVLKETEEYDTAAAALNLWKYKDVYVQPLDVPLSVRTFLSAAPFVAFAFVFCAPVIALSYFCGKKFADDTNVISLWRILSGTVGLALWACLMFDAIGISKSLLYFAVSLFGFILYGAFKKHFISLVNYFKHKELREQFVRSADNAVKKVS